MSSLRRKLERYQRGREAERIYKRERNLAYAQAQREALLKDAYKRGLKVKKTRKQLVISGVRKGAKITWRQAKKLRR